MPELTKPCFTCGIEKPLSKFAIVKKQMKKTDEIRQYHIRDCYSCRGKVSYVQKKNKDPEFLVKKQKYYKAFRDKDKRTTMIYTARHKSKKLGLPFNIDKHDINIPEYCPLLGIKLELTKRKVDDASPSLDRISPRLGYVKGNVWVISNKANRIKNDATPDEIEIVAINLRKKLNDHHT